MRSTRRSGRSTFASVAKKIGGKKKGGVRVAF
jgi:hypothetical protein